MLLSIRSLALLLMLLLVHGVAAAQAEPAITLTAPAAGDQWCAGASQTIAWDTVNAGETFDVLLSSNGGVTYNVIAPNITGTSHQWQVPININADSMYRISVRRSGGGLADTSGMFRINRPPTPTLQPLNISIPVNNHAMFTAQTSGWPKPAVVWQVSTDTGKTWKNVTGNQAVGVETERLTLYYVDAKMDGNLYRATFSNQCGSDTSKPASLAVTWLEIVEPNGGEIACAGQPITIRWKLQGFTGQPQYAITYTPDSGKTWKSLATVLQSETYTWNTVLQQAPSLNYRVRVQLTNNPIVSDTTDTTFILYAKPTVAANPRDTAANQGRLVSFAAASYGLPLPEVEWQGSDDNGKNWIRFSSTTSTEVNGRVETSLRTSAIATNDSGTLYRAIFRNQCGADTTRPALLRVIKDPVSGVETPSESRAFAASISPNPSHEAPTLTLRLAAGAPVKVLIAEPTGKIIATPFSSPFLPAGKHLITLPSGLPSGGFACVVRVGSQQQILPMVVVR